MVLYMEGLEVRLGLGLGLGRQATWPSHGQQAAWSRAAGCAVGCIRVHSHGAPSPAGS